MEPDKQQIEARLFNDTARYADIIDRPRPESKAHLRMAQSDRAAQFAPFAALTGYQQLIQEKAELSAKKTYPTFEQKRVLTVQLHQLQATRLPKLVTINYFNDAAGYYQSVTTQLQWVDWDRGRLFCADDLSIAIANVRRLKTESK